MKKKILFIDRDGTLIIEPPIDFQVDSLEKLSFYPKVVTNLSKIAQSGQYLLVMVTNQDGLGTTAFPEENFLPPHQKMIETFANEGILFDAIHIDKTFEHENAPTRKPRIGMLTQYLNEAEYDLANSFVIGDRLTDVELAKNLGAKAILMQTKVEETTDNNIVLQTTDWAEIAHFLLQKTNRNSTIKRKTKETDIEIALNLDGAGKANINTGIGFFDHMLEQIAFHAQIDLTINAKGDLHIDQHHTIEDTAIALGMVFKETLGNKKGIERYGFFNLVMDDALAQVALDLSGRAWLQWSVQWHREQIGNFPTEMASHFFKSFTDHCACNISIQCTGENDHHQIEAIFKAFAKAMKQAIKITHTQIPSTKGIV
ncbi:MAG: bifunctional histidinol-phosphatase/imidazoleglycerol-phosphate dehydratase HisB [Cytophagales bacterium]|nr:MAG: bifunctional histidinol-phosphatase/imidazoleglycerol-phosphate dehydratase HisB [Cytophagales bacterium]